MIKPEIVPVEHEQMGAHAKDSETVNEDDEVQK